MFLATELYGAKSFVGTVKKVIDGDSLIIGVGATKIELRLYGIDCPEYLQPFSAAAKSYMKENVYGQKVEVQPYYYDAYGRQIGLVISGETVMNELLVEAGLAWVHPAYCKKKVCRDWRQKEKRARKEGRGLWRDRHPIPPWQWKKMKKRQ